MIKRLLSVALLSCSLLGASADEYNVGDYVYSSGACYQIAGLNLLQNSDFSSGMSQWNSINETVLDDVFVLNEGAGPSGENSLKASSSSSNGCYQALSLSAPGTYVLVFQIKGSAAGFTDVSRTNNAPFQSGMNYINLIFNEDGVPTGATSRVELPLGEGGSFGTDDWTTVCLPLVVEAEEGYLIPEIAALAEGVEVTNVEVHLATAVYDSRTAQNFKDYCQAIYDGYDWNNDPVYMEAVGEREYVSQFKTAIDNLQEAIDTKTNIEGKELDLRTTLDAFLTSNIDEIFQYMGKGNNAASWSYWTSKFNKLNQENTGNPYWSFNTDRWCHKTASENAELGIEWMTGSSGDWDNIATATLTLEKGTYFFGFEGEGGRGTINKNDWARSKAIKTAYFEYFFNGDTIQNLVLDPALRQKFIHGFTLDKDSTITFGIRCNNTEGVDRNNWHSTGSTGMFTKLYAPVLYKVYSGVGLTEQEKYYLKDVEEQLTEMDARLATTYTMWETDATRPWGKDELKAGYDEYKAQYDEWRALTEDEVLENYLYEDKVLSDTIKNNAVNPIKNTLWANYTNLNKPFTDLVDTLALANSVYADPTFELYDLATFKAVIDAAQDVYNTKMAAATSEFVQEDSLALREAAHSLILGIEAFKNSLVAEAILDVDFETKAVQNEDETYSIVGAKGQMDFASNAFKIWGGEDAAEAWNTSTTFVQGYWNGGETENPGVLRVGNYSATATIADEDLPNVATADTELGSAVDLVNVSFDVYYGYLGSKNLTFALQDINGETIISESLGAGTWDDQLGIADGLYNSVGSSSASNSAIYTTANNKTHFDLVLNYGSQTIGATMDQAKNGSRTVSGVEMKSIEPLKYFVLSSNYNNGDRRCWFDNLKIEVVRKGAKVTNVPGAAALVGDANGDGQITMADANAIVNYFLAEDKSTIENFDVTAADANNDGQITMADANAVVNIFLGSAE